MQELKVFLLKVVFSTHAASESFIKASKVLRQHRRLLVRHAARWTGHRKFDIYRLVNRMIKRCDALNLYAKDDQDILVGITTLLTAIASGTHRIEMRGKI